MDQKFFQQICIVPDNNDDFPVLKLHQCKQQTSFFDKQVESYTQKMKLLQEQYSNLEIAPVETQSFDIYSELQIPTLHSKTEQPSNKNAVSKSPSIMVEHNDDPFADLLDFSVKTKIL
ncbi:Hypothetical_protein [Hexamita inflata]|uniref:Hypothetical_protein n=1 Tax=Hexamita inflata TaxID=28002 RepID=A0AA86QEL9_9EUKA|nr:Hypothetical protein HINF_LOCUS38824 [Hexamita inflata]CAI9957869.1 Hypothetical protein HINF_LOCUS45514 [Hexamita inflata]CAI9961796.1 Hypothetical protein HINF_LOCUS49441 [Hexamita inflata]